ncbi:hypothetical protein [Rhodococcus sp. NBC_00294]|uniref:hypothetical protein n=1 Tax=Rhodococcus sp. NBC_00294 TaxID=2976004 RepID=UPI002E28AFFB|nr:hypothetical protein [Rhodococcus sp. NBC_00294]
MIATTLTKVMMIPVLTVLDRVIGSPDDPEIEFCANLFDDQAPSAAATEGS